MGRVGAPRPVDVVLWGLRLRLLTRGNVAEARILFLEQFWEPGERRFLSEVASPGFVFVDAGANIGGYGLWVLSLLGSECTIVAVEPDPELAARLCFNADTNGAGNLRVVRAALSDREGTGVLEVDSRNRGQNRLVASHDGGAGAPHEGAASPPPGPAGRGTRATVPVRTLLGVATELGLHHIDALKIDIEGMELPVLQAFFRDAPPALRPRIVITEAHDTPEQRRLEELLASLGYRERLRSALNLVLERPVGS